MQVHATWSRIDQPLVQWLRSNVAYTVKLDRSWLPVLKATFDLRIAEPLARTKFGDHIQEYREYVKKHSLHVREFKDHITIHADKWNPDWSFWNFWAHLAEDTPILHAAAGVGLIVAVAIAPLNK